MPSDEERSERTESKPKLTEVLKSAAAAHLAYSAASDCGPPVARAVRKALTKDAQLCGSGISTSAAAAAAAAPAGVERSAPSSAAFAAAAAWDALLDLAVAGNPVFGRVAATIWSKVDRQGCGQADAMKLVMGINKVGLG